MAEIPDEDEFLRSLEFRHLEIDLGTGEVTGMPEWPATPGPPPPPPATRRTRSAPADHARRAANRIRPEVLRDAD